MDFNADNAAIIAEFANCTVTVTLSGVAVRNFRAIWDKEIIGVSPFQSEQSIGKPGITALDSDCAGITSSHLFSITLDSDLDTVSEYALDGKPRADGSGFTIVFLSVKR